MFLLPYFFAWMGGLLFRMHAAVTSAVSRGLFWHKQQQLLEAEATVGDGEGKNDKGGPPSLSVQQETFCKKYQDRLLATFAEPLASAHDWNENAREVQALSPEALAEELQHKDNPWEASWRRRVLMEPTPRGNVYMHYDVYKQGFAYYCDQSVMPYEVLNAVAMKYVLTYRCRDFFVDESVLRTVAAPTQRKQEPLVAAATATATAKPTTNNRLPFAKFKDYNTTKHKLPAAATVQKQVNRFIHVGNTRNFQPLLRPPKVFATNGFATNLLPAAAPVNMSYAEFKKQQQLSARSKGEATST
jgi:hypothetical protein